MPYTPPAKQSPGISRSESLGSKASRPQNVQVQTSRSGAPSGHRPNLPRSHSSTSYLHRSRRSPSLTNQSGLPTPGPTPEHWKFDDRPSQATPCASLRQSPPPVNDLAIPIGAVISPPDSAQSSGGSSDDETPAKTGRRPELDNLAELQAAIRVIEQQREGSPILVEEERRKARSSLGLVMPNSEAGPHGIVSPPLSQEARKISHSRSSTESAIVDLNRPLVDSPERSSESDDECDVPRKKPPMLRKKSGELVRPALRPASARRRPSSMPGTPTYSKAVHFDQHLEQVRHFLQVDRPLAVSANTSPVDHYDSETEFPFSSPREPKWEWEIKVSNFPRETPQRAQKAVRVERVSLSEDKKTLIGAVAVQNLAFHKTVVARFTLDYWKTVSEVTAEYSSGVRRRAATTGRDDGCDRFSFNLRLEDHVHLDKKTLFFCVRYSVNGQEHWDSNDGINYRVEFTKKSKAGNGSSGPQPLAAVPRSAAHQGPSSAPGGRARPMSMPSFDDFAHGFGADFPRSPLRLRAGPNDTAAAATGDDRIVPDAPGLRQKAPAAQAFGNRYDFGASLSAAIQAASPALGDRGGVAPKAGAAGPRPKPADLARDKPPLESQSYNELIDKYCFFGSAKPASPGTAPAAPAPRIASPTEIRTAPPVAAPPRPSPVLEREKKTPPAPATTPATVASQPPSARVSRSPSPANRPGIAPRAASPGAFGYPYHQPMPLGGFGDGCTPTAVGG